MEQYFTKNPTTKEEIYSFKWNAIDEEFNFSTSNSVFSKSAVDFGSMVMINTFVENESNFIGNILDLGCGYGPVGVILAKILDKVEITMVDINERAVKLAKINSEANKVASKLNVYQSNIFEGVNENFDRILTNPPIRAGKKTVYAFFDGSYEHLEVGGKLYVVIQKKQGANSAVDKLKSLFGNCETLYKKSGYFILCSERLG
ncbi:class I SAM-dependent methyltransferase [Sedimentibacter sp. zth1]|uniref:class I SAM-dependent methyltransferase n=1 Tax=Sedimentibacter sp. zth1 TaxID=2816908 RepID=UPI001A92EF0A|nr:methyltransferase [Sedimentibacter sp. zth1]QSX06366.1 class I SAM-dependent methyltransferase [Sedimentibacter sp. zth1]